MGERKKPIIVLIDGEHYPDVILDTLVFLENERGFVISGIVFLGGTEKLEDLQSIRYRNVPVYTGKTPLEAVSAAVSNHHVDMVIDLSDEPVITYAERFRIASRVLASGISYAGADFKFDAPSLPFLFDKPGIGIWGSGKRVGKTAISGYLLRFLIHEGFNPCVLTMGRGGPATPEVIDEPCRVDDNFLVETAKRGIHAASDHFENAMMGRARAVGCRRCGGGMAGMPYFSNVADGARLVSQIECDVVLCEGSGAAIPPVGVDAVLLAVSALQPIENVLGYLGPYRLLLSDLVLVTMCEDFLVPSSKLQRLVDGIKSINPEARVLKTVFRPRPLGDIRGRRIFLTSTAPDRAVQIQVQHLEEEYAADVVGSSANLANRKELRDDLKDLRGAEVLVTELKAAGVDTVSSKAKELGLDLVYMENVPVSIGGELDEEIRRLLLVAEERCQKRLDGMV